KTPEQIAVMREAGLVVARTLRVLADAVRPGVTTAELDAIAEDEIRTAGATPSFKGYHGYPATICTSVNEEIVHGIPSPRRSLADGDIISIDCGATVGGGAGDAGHRRGGRGGRVARRRGAHRRGRRQLRRGRRSAQGVRDRAVARTGPGPRRA